MPAVDMEQTGKNIEAMMNDRHLTPKDMQRVFGFGTVNTVYTWIRGKKMPNIDNIVMMTGIFGVKIDDIIAVREI